MPRATSMVTAPPTQPSPRPASERLYFLDWLRIGAFAVLVLYHVGLYYVRWDFHVKSPFSGPELEPWMKLSEPWRLSLLFMVSGAATSQMLRVGVDVALIRRRSRMLLLPLLCGVVLVVPPQSYFQVVQQYGYGGNFLDFLALYFSHFRGFCQGEKCLVLPTWNHLWFLPYLWSYTMVLCGLVAFWPQVLVATAAIVHKALGGLALLVLPVGVLFSLRLALLTRYPSTHALWNDWFNHAVYFGMFLAGALFATPKPMWERLAAVRWPALVAAIGSWYVLAFAALGGLTEQAAVAINQWAALVAAFGFACVHLNFDNAWRARLTEAVFPVYILHQTIIIVGSQVLLPLRLRPLAEGPVLVVATFALSYAGYEVLRRISVLRPWFGMARTKRHVSSPNPSIKATS